ncbi:hypothetical protein EV426DRAFT_672849, partial [Tirmania nivea]
RTHSKSVHVPWASPDIPFSCLLRICSADIDSSPLPPRLPSQLPPPHPSPLISHRTRPSPSFTPTPALSTMSARNSAYDGQWNPRVNAYILPPLIGLPFHEMVKNGEGLRHAGIPKYYPLIVTHAVFMSLPFLFLIPAAIFSARFKKHENPRKAIQLHFILNTVSAVFLTIGFLAGWFAVNKGEWGGNPHHIIGTTVYGGVLVQGVFGVFLKARETNKLRKLGQVGFKSMLHMWFGRALWLLGLAQIPLGLYLYGSPLVFFIIYSALTFLLFLIYFIFEYVSNRRTTKYQMAPGHPPVGSVRGGEGRTSDGSSRSHHGRSNSHSRINYTEMTETTHPATVSTMTPGTFDSRTSYDGQEGTEFLSSHDGVGGFGDGRNNHTAMPTTPKLSRFNRISQSIEKRFRRRGSSVDGAVIGGATPISIDASTRPPTGSTANRHSGIGGLHAPPNNNRLPPIRIAPVGALDQHAFNNHTFRRGDGRGSGPNDPLKDTSPQRAEFPGQTTTTTTGTFTTNPSTSAVSPVSPVSSGIVQMPPMPHPQSDVSTLSSDRPGAKYAGGHLFSPLLPPIKGPQKQQDVAMPPSPFGDTYFSDEGPASPQLPPQKGQQYPPLLPSKPPRAPLPIPPEAQQAAGAAGASRRSRSHNRSHDRVPSDTSTQPDAVIRIPLSRNSDTINIPAGQLIRNNLPPGEQPQVSVQVKVDRVGRSVTVRRLPEDEAAIVRQNRQRQRAARAEERERAIEQEISAKRRSLALGGGGAGVSEVSGETGVTTVSSGTLPNVLPLSLPPAGRSGTAARTGSSPQRVSLPPPPSPHHTAYTDESSEDDYTSDERGYATKQQAGGASVVGSRVSGAGRESVVSAAPTDDAEAEEKIRERRRKKRREERKEGGLTSAELKGAGGTYYGGGMGDGGVGLGGSGSGSGAGAGGSLAKGMEWS